jgi:hypothetical protein
MTGPVDLLENHDINGSLELRESKKGNTWAVFQAEIPLFPAGDDVEEALDRILDATQDQKEDSSEVDVEKQLQKLQEKMEKITGGSV